MGRAMEWETRWLYDYLRADQAHPPGPYMLLGGLIGHGHIAFVEEGRSWTERRSTGFFVGVPRHLAPTALTLVHARACAEIALGILHPKKRPSAHAVRDLALALIMPRAAAAVALRALGPRVNEIAAHFVLPTDDAKERLETLALSMRNGGAPSVCRIGVLRPLCKTALTDPSMRIRIRIEGAR